MCAGCMVSLTTAISSADSDLWRLPIQRCCGYLPGTQECAQGVCIREPGVQGEVLERDRGSCAFVAAPNLAELTASALEVRDSFVTSVQFGLAGEGEQSVELPVELGSSQNLSSRHFGA